MTDKTLEHVGILGMKWGRRKASSKSSSPSSDHKVATSLKKKHLSEMSNDELKKLTTRMQLEKQYKDLSKTDISEGRKVVNEILTNVGKDMAKKAITDAITTGVSKGIPALKLILENARK